MFCGSSRWCGNPGFGVQSADAQRAGVSWPHQVCSTLILHWAVPSNRKDLLKRKSPR
jgi:hypothetical protein